MVKSPSAGVFSSNTIFMLDGTSTAAPATGLRLSQVAGSDHSSIELGAGVAIAGRATTATTTGVVSKSTGLISTGPLAPAAMEPGGTAVMGPAVTALPLSPACEPEGLLPPPQPPTGSEKHLQDYSHSR